MPKSPQGVNPSVEIGAPSKADVWMHVATPADQDRLARPDSRVGRADLGHLQVRRVLDQYDVLRRVVGGLRIS